MHISIHISVVSTTIFFYGLRFLQMLCIPEWSTVVPCMKSGPYGLYILGDPCATNLFVSRCQGIGLVSRKPEGQMGARFGASTEMGA